MNNRVKRIESPYDNIQAQINRNTEIVEMLVLNKDIDNYDLSLMIPKITYEDNFIVCHYLKDDKLYHIDEEDITEVEVMEVLEYNENFEVIKANGEPMDEDELLNYSDEWDCGEADDMTCYVYFKYV